MTLHTWLVYGLGFILVWALCLTQVFLCAVASTTYRALSGRDTASRSQAGTGRQTAWDGCTTEVQGLQCYGCNIIQGQRYVDVGCSNPEVITCTHSHKGFKHRFCIKTESTALGIVLTSGCATSRHCQQQELPGVRIHCCDSDLCNSAPSWHSSTLHYICALFSLLLLRMWL